MREQYPFFRDADERTLAVIGGEAADSDLNGVYQKPYAILTQKRLYCKNERGNFIIDSSKLLGAGRIQNSSSSAWLLWGAFAINGFMLLWSIISWLPSLSQLLEMRGSTEPDLLNSFQKAVIMWVVALISLAAFLLLRKKNAKIAPIMLCILPGYSLIQFIQSIQSLISMMQEYGGVLWGSYIIRLLLCVAPIILVVVYYAMSKDKDSKFGVLHTGGSFDLSVKDYPANELENFEAAVKALTGKANGK